MGSNRFKSKHKVYRGRMPRRKKIIISIIILVILAFIGTGVYYITQNYMVYTAQGFYFDFSFLNGKNKTPDDGGIVEIEGDKKPDDADKKPEEEEPKTEPIKTMQAITADILQLNDATYRAQIIEQASASGANSIYLTIMDEAGILNIPATGSLAQTAGLTHKNAAEFALGIKELQNANLDIIGAVSACRNNFGTQNNREVAQQVKSGKRWIDGNKIGWFNPAEQGAKDYIAEIIKSCKELGISQVILDNVSYPTNGQTNLINVNPNIDRAQAIADLISAAKSAAGDMKIGAVLTEQAALLAEDSLGGQIAIMMAPVADSLVTAVPSEALVAAVTSANIDCELISIVPLAQNPNSKDASYILK